MVDHPQNRDGEGRATRLDRLADALEVLARRWRREARDPNVAWALKDRFGGAAVEITRTQAVVAGLLNAHVQNPGSPARIAPQHLARLYRALDSLAILATLEPPAVPTPSMTIVNIETHGRVRRLEAAARRVLRDVGRALAVGAVGATLLAAMPAAAAVVGDQVVNPLTGANEQVVEVISPVAVRTSLGHIIFLATTVGATFTDPETGEAYEVTAVTTNAGGYVVSVTVKDSASVLSTLDVVVDKAADIASGEAPGAPGSDGSGTGMFTFPTAVADNNNYVNAHFGNNGGDGKDGGGVRICTPWGCATIGKKPSKGGNGQNGPNINATIDDRWGDIQTVSDNLSGILVTSVGGNGGQGGDGYGVNIPGATGGTAGKGGDVTVTASVDVTTSGDNAHGIFAQSRAGRGGDGGKGYIFSGGGSGGSPAQGGSVSVSNFGDIATTGVGSFGILAQSLGGAAGGGGASYGVIGVGGGGSSGGNGGNVQVDHWGNILTTNNESHGILAQSIGGSGGSGGASGGLITFGDKGAAGGIGGTATIIAHGGSTTTTRGEYAFGLYAQSIGGGGGNGGRATGAVSLGSGGGSGGDSGLASIVVEANAYVTTSGVGSHAVFAQSVGGGGGNAGKTSGAIALGSSGDAGGAGGEARVTSGGVISTTGDEARGIFAQSVGGGGGSGQGTGGLFSMGGSGKAGGAGAAVTVVTQAGGSVTTRGVGADGVFAQSVGGGGGSGSTSGGVVSLGGSGGGGGAGGAVSVTNGGKVTTTGALARALFAQSVGGGGGTGGRASGPLVSVGGSGDNGGAGGDVTVINSGALITHGYDSHAIFAQSIGGGGGDGGGGGGWFAFGGSGAGGGTGGKVTVTNTGSIDTFADGAGGVFAQSVGGGGGNGGNATSVGAFIALSIGGSGGTGSAGGLVTVKNTGHVATGGNNAAGVFAQSVGGGGGNGGFGVSASAGIYGSVSIGIGGKGGGGGRGGDVHVTADGDIITVGTDSRAVFAQSVGGGGGNGGYSVAAALAVGDVGAVAGSVAVGGEAGDGGLGGHVTIDYVDGVDIETYGARSAGLFAQSIGGGGGNGGWSGAIAAAAAGGVGGAVGVSVGGAGGKGGAGGDVTIDTAGWIHTRGVDAAGVYAQSIGGGGGTGGYALTGALAGGGGGAGSASVGVGGSGGDGGAAGVVSVTSHADILTEGDRSFAIYAQAIGGGGGAGGWTGALAAAGGGAGAGAVGVAVGGSGGGGGAGGKVDVSSHGVLITQGLDASAIYAQSVGGGGGAGGFSLAGALAGAGAGAGSASVGVGGSGGGGGDSGVVTVNTTGNITTTGDRSNGIFAQGVGGGGGAGGWTGALAAAGAGVGAGAVGVSVGGSGGDGGKGGDVFVTTAGVIMTEGHDAHGIMAQSVGGGGGSGGFSLAAGLAGAGTGAGSASVGVGGSGGGGGDAGEVSVISNGDLQTVGDRSSAIFAQAVGGGGGAGGWTGTLAAAGAGVGAGAVGVSIGGSGGDGGLGGKVTVTSHGMVFTYGVDAAGIFAQSVGGGGGAGGFSMAGAGAGAGEGAGAVGVGVGGSAGGGGDAGEVMVTSTGDIYTQSDRSAGIFAQAVGGGGGTGGWSGGLAGAGAGTGAGAVGVSVGGSGGDGGLGGKVTVNSHGKVITQGADSAGVYAQSVGGGGGTGGFSLAAGLGGGGTGAGAGSVGVGGSGGGGGDAGSVTVGSTGDILTTGDRSSAVFAQAIGGGGGSGGWSGALAAAGGGTGAGAVGVSIGGSGGDGGLGGVVIVTSDGLIETRGVDSHGVMAQSVGGGGGSGGFSLAAAGAGGGQGAGAGSVSVGGSGAGGGSADTVTVTITGSILTSGDRSAGVYAQSVGGGGGDGGWSGALALAGGGKGAGAVGVSVGGSAGLGGDGKRVEVDNSATIETRGVDAAAILAQSVGGGGGTGGFSLAGAGGLGDSAGAASISIGGGGGAGGDAGVVVVNTTGQVATHGDRSYGVQAQSIGGGGGTGGFAGAVSAALASKTGVGIGVSVGGSGGVGGDSDDVFLTSTLGASTDGESAHGLFAQSVGGGGGSGGFSISGAFTAGDLAIGLSAALGGDGGVGGDSGDIWVDADGVTVTSGDRSYAIFAQSVGGGGGDGGFAGAISGGLSSKSTISLGLTLGGAGGAAGDAGDVHVVNNGDVGTSGADSYAIFAQSVGGGGGTGGMAVSATLGGAKSKNFSVALGGSGGAGGAAGDVTVASDGLVITQGAGATAIFAQSVGGGGGAGGAAGALAMSGGDSVNLAVNVGGHGGAGSTGGSVAVTNDGQIITYGESAHGVFAESVGGGGGHGGMAGIDENAWSDYMAGGSGTVSFGSNSQNISVALGGAGGTGDDGGAVTVTNNGAISTFGAQSNVIYAQSVGGGGGDAGVATAASGAFGASKNGTYAIALGGSGGEAGDGGLVTVINTGDLWSVGDGSAGILAQSVGGGGGAGGDARGFSMSFSNKETTKSGLTSVNLSIGGKGGAAGDGGDVSVDNSGQIVTEGGQSVGVYAQSVGGGGGRGGLISTQGAEIVDFIGLADKGEAKGGQIAIGGDGAGGGDGGLVMVTNSGLIMTLGQGSHAVFAQSVGGGGGDGGSGLAGEVSVGGQGGVAGDGGDVIVRNSGVIITQGDLARGVFAQSVGGGGGTGGATDYDGEDTYSYRQELSDTMGVIGNLTSTKDLIESFSEPAWGIGIGGMGGSAGDGGDVSVDNSGAIYTSGTLSHGVFAQSVGGGGGTGGEGVITSVGQIVFSGAGGSAGNGGDVTVTNSGLIQTEGFGAYGVFAQSIGGGGGVAGDMSLGIASWGDLTTYGGEDYSSYGSFSVNPLDGYGGDGGDVTVTNTGDIVILGEGGVGIFAQSIGGGGGLFGSAMGLSFAGSLGGWGDSGVVTVNQNGNVYVGGKNGIGAFFQSLSGPGYSAQDINVTINGYVRGGSVYGKGVLVDGGLNNVINLLGVVSAASNIAIISTSGNDTFNSYKGVVGNIDLGGGSNTFNNLAGSTLETLDYVILNGATPPKSTLSRIRNMAIDPAAGLLNNDGVISPGGPGVVQVTLVSGSYNQSAGASFFTDLDLHRTGLTNEIDRLNVTGLANVQGVFNLQVLNAGYALPGVHTATIIDSGGPLTTSGLTLNAPPSIVAKFSLTTTQHDLNLKYEIDFSPVGLNANRTAVGDYINAIQSAGGSAAFAPVAEQLFFETSLANMANYYDSFGQESYGDQAAMAMFAADRFADSMMSCPAAPGDTASESRGCTWGRVSTRKLSLEATSQDMAFTERSLGLAAGFEASIGEDWRIGAAASGEAIQSGITGRTDGDGDRYQLGLVVKRLAGPLTLAVSAAAGASELTANRYVILPAGLSLAKGEQSLNFTTITARASWRFGSDAFYAKPILDIGSTSVSTDGFAETGAGPLNLVVPDQTTDTTRASFKVEFGGELKQGDTSAWPYARIGVSSLVSGAESPFSAGFESAPAGVNPFDVKSRLDRTVLDTELGITVVGERGSGRLGWSGQFGDRLSNQTFSVKLTLNF